MCALLAKALKLAPTDTEALCDTAVLFSDGSLEEREAARGYYERCLAVDAGLVSLCSRSLFPLYRSLLNLDSSERCLAVDAQHLRTLSFSCVVGLLSWYSRSLFPV